MVRAPVVETSGWYLRGDIGVGNQNFKSFDFQQTDGGSSGRRPGASTRRTSRTRSSSAAGVGYAWNNWLRFDVTGEYRADVKFKAVGSYTEFCPGGRCFDVYDGDHRPAVVLANAYIDLGTWWCLTPFIGAGVGARLSHDRGVSDIGLNHRRLGLRLRLRQRRSQQVELRLGAACRRRLHVTNRSRSSSAIATSTWARRRPRKSSAARRAAAPAADRAPSTPAHDFDSHDFKLGMRWMLQPEPVYQPPLMRRG